MATVLITGVGRTVGIGAACARTLAAAGWDIAMTCWRPYDREFMPGSAESEPDDVLNEVRAQGVRAELIHADLADVDAPRSLFDALHERLGPCDALVAAHCRDVAVPLLGTVAAEFDLHFAINARSVALLIQEFTRQLSADDGRIVAFTSDALADNVPYGVSKGALDRVIQAAAVELGPRGIRANCINPGPTDTGWIDDELRAELSRTTPLGRPGLPQEAADLVAFLLSPEGAWITGQVLHSNGGFQ